MLLERMMIPYSEKTINYSQHAITADDKKAVIAALDSEWLAGNGPISKRYADELCRYTGYQYAVPVCNGTVALYVAYCALSEVYMPDLTMPNLTFVATANAAIEADLEVIPVDVSEQTLVFNNSVVGVSFAGHPSYGHYLCDDAHGLRPNMVKGGNLVSTISTHAVKQLTTGEGGAILTNRHDIYKRIAEFVDHGRGEGNRSFGYGLNFRLPEMNCALGLSQLKRASEMLVYRQMLAKTYYNLLAGVPGLRLPANHQDHAWHLFVVRFDSQEIRDFVKAGLLDDNNVRTQIHYPPLTSYNHIGGDRDDYPNTYDAWETGLSIPMHNSLSFEDVETVSNAVIYQLEKWQRLNK